MDVRPRAFAAVTRPQPASSPLRLACPAAWRPGESVSICMCRIHYSTSKSELGLYGCVTCSPNDRLRAASSLSFDSMMHWSWRSSIWHASGSLLDATFGSSIAGNLPNQVAAAAGDRKAVVVSVGGCVHDMLALIDHWKIVPSNQGGCIHAHMSIISR